MRITQPQAAAWGELSKMGTALQTLDTNLLDQLETQIIGRVGSFGVDTISWTDASNTPTLIQTVIAQKYVSWIIDRQYSEDTDLSAYGQRLDQSSEQLLAGIQDGSIEIPGITSGTPGQPSFYPDDTTEPMFSVGMTF